MSFTGDITGTVKIIVTLKDGIHDLHARKHQEREVDDYLKHLASAEELLNTLDSDCRDYQEHFRLLGCPPRTGTEETSDESLGIAVTLVCERLRACGAKGHKKLKHALGRWFTNLKVTDVILLRANLAGALQNLQTILIALGNKKTNLLIKYAARKVSTVPRAVMHSDIPGEMSSLVYDNDDVFNPFGRTVEELRRTAAIIKLQGEEKKANSGEAERALDSMRQQTKIDKHKNSPSYVKKVIKKKAGLLKHLEEGFVSEHWLLYRSAGALMRRGYQVYLPGNYTNMWPNGQIRDFKLDTYYYYGNQALIEVVLDLKVFALKAIGYRFSDWTALYREKCANCKYRHCGEPGHSSINAYEAPKKA